MITMLHYIYMITITPSDLEQLSPSSPLLAAEVFLLCFSISDHASLYTALDHWLPLLKVTLLLLLMMMMMFHHHHHHRNIKDLCPTTPAVLVGCKSDLRTSSRLQVVSATLSSLLCHCHHKLICHHCHHHLPNSSSTLYFLEDNLSPTLSSLSPMPMSMSSTQILSQFLVLASSFQRRHHDFPSVLCQLNMV